jgi:hypothetical protein
MLRNVNDCHRIKALTFCLMGTGANGHHGLCIAGSYCHIVWWPSWCHSNNSEISNKAIQLSLIFSSDSCGLCRCYYMVGDHLFYNGTFLPGDIRWGSEVVA